MSVRKPNFFGKAFFFKESLVLQSHTSCLEREGKSNAKSKMKNAKFLRGVFFY